MNKTMEKKIYDKPDIKIIESLFITPLCTSSDGDADGVGEDFEWGN